MTSALNDFLVYLVAEKGCSEKTVMSYENALRNFVGFCRQLDEELTWQTIDKDVVRRWLMGMMDDGKVAATVARHLSALRSFYRYLLLMERVDRDPLRGIKSPKKEKNLPVFVKESEMNRLLDEVEFPEGYKGLQEHTILLAFYMTGVRLSELVGLDVRDVDFGLKRIKVTGKRNKQRYIPVGEELLAAFRRLIGEHPEGELALDESLFADLRKKRMTSSKVAAVVKRYLSLVTNIKRKSPHVLRHTFATVMLNNEAGLEVVKELLGHESLATTEIYTHTTFEELKKIYKNAHPRV